MRRKTPSFAVLQARMPDIQGRRGERLLADIANIIDRVFSRKVRSRLQEAFICAQSAQLSSLIAYITNTDTRDQMQKLFDDLAGMRAAANTGNAKEALVPGGQ